MGKFDTFLVTLTLTFMFTSFIFSWVDDDVWMKRAINHSAAHYDSQTGKFTWNTEEKK